MPGTMALPSTITRYILPTPPSYYHAACILRPCSFLISSPDFFLCLLPNPTKPLPTVQIRLPTMPTQRYHHLSKE